jgi:hypothetical protein
MEVDILTVGLYLFVAFVVKGRTAKDLYKTYNNESS